MLGLEFTTSIIIYIFSGIVFLADFFSLFRFKKKSQTIYWIIAKSLLWVALVVMNVFLFSLLEVVYTFNLAFWSAEIFTLQDVASLVSENLVTGFTSIGLHVTADAGFVTELHFVVSLVLYLVLKLVFSIIGSFFKPKKPRKTKPKKEKPKKRETKEGKETKAGENSENGRKEGFGKEIV